MKTPPNLMSSRRCGIAAEAFAASLLARAGYDILIPYGANQPGYDIAAVSESDPSRRLLVSVKGNQDGEWMLAVEQGVMSGAILETWKAKQRASGVSAFFLVQYLDVALDQMPHCYVAPVDPEFYRPKQLPW